MAILFLLIAGSSAQAQTAPPFEPYTVTAQEHQAILGYLGDVPSKYANPLIQQLMQMEQLAQQKKSKSDAAKNEFGKPAPDADKAK
jgi:hypothetical protein